MAKEDNKFMRWLHKGKLFCSITRAGQWIVQGFIIMASAQFMIEYVIPMVCVMYFDGLGITEEVSSATILAVWAIPMLFVAGLAVLIEWWVIRMSWKHLSHWFDSIRTKRTDELAKKYGEVDDE